MKESNSWGQIYFWFGRLVFEKTYYLSLQAAGLPWLPTVTARSYSAWETFLSQINVFQQHICWLVHRSLLMNWYELVLRLIHYSDRETIKPLPILATISHFFGTGRGKCSRRKSAEAQFCQPWFLVTIKEVLDMRKKWSKFCLWRYIVPCQL